MSARPLGGRCALVTGGGSGLGRAEALELASRGAAVAVVDVDAPSADGVAAAITAGGGSAAAFGGDLADDAFLETVVPAVVERLGGLDILVNNAGILNGERGLPDITAAELDRLLDVNLRSAFLLSVAAARRWREQARERGEAIDGRIVNTSSEAFLHGSPWRVDYATSKAALVTLTIGTAEACGTFGVRANAICPRAQTGMTHGLPGFDARYSDGTSRFAAEHVARFVGSLVGPASAHLTGNVFVVFGRSFDLLAPPTVAHHSESSGDWEASALDAELSSLPPSTYVTHLHPGLTVATRDPEWEQR